MLVVVSDWCMAFVAPQVSSGVEEERMSLWPGAVPMGVGTGEPLSPPSGTG